MKRNLLPSVVSALLMAGAVACSGTHYFFASREPTPLTPTGVWGATYALPEGQEKSTVRIFPMGVRNTDRGRVFQIRLYFENFSEKPWRVDTGRQLIKLPGVDSQIASLNSADTPKTPLVEVPNGMSRLLNLMFLVPRSVGGDSSLAGFDLTWEITAEGKPFTRTTNFVLTRVQDDPEYSTKPVGSSSMRRVR